MILKNKQQLILCAAAVVMAILLFGAHWILGFGLLGFLIISFYSGYRRGVSRKTLQWSAAAVAGIAFLSLLLCSYHTTQYEHITEQLSSQSYFTLTGTVHRKTLKSDQVVYTLKHIHLQTENGSESIYGKILLYLDEDSTKTGAVIRVSGDADFFSHASNQGNFDALDYYESQDIICRIYGENPEVIREPVISVKETLFTLQSSLSRILEEELNERDAGVLGALLLGNKGLLMDETKEAYQEAGISHILAISGLHISILGFGIYRFLRRWKLGYPVSVTTSGLLITGFCLMAGMGVSVIRALVMYLVFMGAEAVGKQYSSLSALALAAVVVLLIHPFYLYQGGFLFSFTALVGILMIPRQTSAENEKGDRNKGKGIRGMFQRGIRSLGQSLRFGIYLQLWLLPVTAYFYYEISPYALFLNLLVLPLCSFLFGFGMIGALCGLFWNFGSRCILISCHLILSVYEGAIDLSALLPGHNLVVGCPKGYLLLLYYLVLAAVCVLQSAETFYLPKLNDLFRPLWKKEWLLLLPVGCLVGLLVLTHLPSEGIWFLDVGQGDGICIRDDTGRTVMIDGGSTSESQVGEYRMEPFLNYQGVGCVDYWIITHEDEDHISGLEELLTEGYPVKHLLLAVPQKGAEGIEKLVDLAEENDTEVIWDSEGDQLSLSDMKMTCLYPEKDDTASDTNGLSQVWGLEADGVSVLFTGDLGSEQEEVLLDRELVGHYDILKVGHHGSKYSSEEEFLKTVDPTYAIISAGLNNRYGHPHQETLDRLEDVGAEICQTMDGGEVAIVKRRGKWYLTRPCGEESM